MGSAAGAALFVLSPSNIMPRIAFTQPRVAPAYVPAAEPRLQPGTEVGNYVIEHALGEGGMAVVYQARHQVLPRRVAVKVMRGAGLGAAGRARLLREACVLADLDHPAIVDCLDAGVLHDGRAWLAMDVIDGEALSRRIAMRRSLPSDEVASLIAHLAGALAVAHAAGVVHRDLKPDNVLVVDDATCPVRVIDWGIAQAARAAREPRLTIEGSIAGTPHYMAPEQIRGEVVDGRCDVYALGCMAYEALSGAPPFVGAGALEVVAQHLTTAPRSIFEVAPATPAWLGTLVMWMLAKDPEARPRIGQVLELLDSNVSSPQIVIELQADLPEDEAALDRELDLLIDDLVPRLALGSNP